jgi:hypothetical protein
VKIADFGMARDISDSGEVANNPSDAYVPLALYVQITLPEDS